MRDDEQLDLSSLDPMHDAGHWDAVIQRTMARVAPTLRERADGAPLVVIGGWVKPVLAAAAVLLALLVPAELALEAREVRVERVERLVTLSAAWQPTDPPPSGAEFVRVLAERMQP